MGIDGQSNDSADGTGACSPEGFGSKLGSHGRRLPKIDARFFFMISVPHSVSRLRRTGSSWTAPDGKQGSQNVLDRYFLTPVEQVFPALGNRRSIL